MTWSYWVEQRLVATVEVPDFRIIASNVEGDVGPAIALVPELEAFVRMVGRVVEGEYSPTSGELLAIQVAARAILEGLEGVPVREKPQ